MFALIDDADYELVSQHSWRPQPRASTFYARSNTDGSFMHRLILRPDDGFVVDHINHDGLDNRRENIRVCTPKQNAHNMRPYVGAISRFKNVTKSKASRFTATGLIEGKTVNLGNFISEELAARVADRHHRQYHGEFAYLNFPDNPISDEFLDEWIEVDRKHAKIMYIESLRKGAKQ